MFLVFLRCCLKTAKKKTKVGFGNIFFHNMFFHFFPQEKREKKLQGKLSHGFPNHPPFSACFLRSFTVPGRIVVESHVPRAFEKKVLGDPTLRGWWWIFVGRQVGGGFK